METQAVELLNAVGAILARYALDVIGAIAILIVGWIAAAWASKGTRRMLGRFRAMDDTLKPLLAQVVRYAILVFVAIAVLAQFGVQTASIIAVLGAAGLAVGLALQGTLQNIAAGIMLLALRPLRVGEYIDAGTVAGTVDEIGLFTTELRTFDGVYVSVPNADLWNRPIKNYSRLPTRRLDLPVRIGMGEDIDQAMTALAELLEKDPRVLSEPPAQVMVLSVNESSVSINMRCWCKASDYWDLLYDLTRAAKLKLDEVGIVIPYPQRAIHIIGAAVEGGK
ncbi:MAG TPA: mechanosensitive ion channel domain-containing protein [Alphaproteobacteria bacterium]